MNRQSDLEHGLFKAPRMAAVRKHRALCDRPQPFLDSAVE
jgi:hypothetical protein